MARSGGEETPHVLLKCDDPGSRRAAASTRFDVLLFRALMGEAAVAVSRRALSRTLQDAYLRRQLGFLFYVGAAACLRRSCLRPDVRGRVAAGRERHPFVLFKRHESRKKKASEQERKVLEPQTA